MVHMTHRPGAREGADPRGEKALFGTIDKGRALYFDAIDGKRKFAANYGRS